MLFKTTDKISEYAEVVSAVNFFSLKTTLRNVEEQRLIPIIGKTLYNSLNDAYDAAADETAAVAALTDKQKALLDRCRMLIGPYLAYYHAPKTELKLSDGGMRREETNTSKTAFQYQVRNFREACLQEAEAQSELLLEFLEENKADYPEWVSDPAFAEYKKLFITTGKEFGQLFPSHSPYKNYWAMRPKMQDVEENHIRPLLGDELFEDLKDKAASASPSFSSKEKILITQLKKAIAAFTVSFSVPLLNVRIDAEGLSVVTAGARASNDNVAGRANPTTQDISHLIRASATSGREWIDVAKKFLENNHTDFPLYPYATPKPVSERCVSYGGSFGLT